MPSPNDIYNQLDTVFRDNGSLPDNALSFGYSVGGERVWKQYRYCWADTCPDTGIIITEPPEGMMGFVTEDLGAQTDGTTPPPGGEPAICTFCDTVLTWYIVSSGKVLAEYDGLTRQLHYKYIYAGDQRIAMRDGVNRLHYYLNDHLGSARVVIDSTGTIKDKYHYLAFGSSLDVTFSTGQPNRYTGKPYDMDAGMNLYYYGRRYYDSDGGRFTQIDPLRNKYPEWGAYVYCADNPLRFVDLKGDSLTAIQLPGRQSGSDSKEGMYIVESTVADDVEAIFTESREAGIDLTINMAFRTTETQTEMYKADQARVQSKGGTPKAAPPGTSSHEGGLAIDLNISSLSKKDQTAVVSIAKAHGFTQSKSEKWHFSANPKRAGYANVQAAIKENQNQRVVKWKDKDVSSTK